MPTSFKEFLTDGKLGPLSMSDTKSSILSKMGMPDWWEGQEKRRCEESDVSVYGHAGIVFARDGNHVAKLEVAFGCGGSTGEPQLPIDLQFADVAFTPATEFDEFIDYVSRQEIPFEKQMGRFGETLVRFHSGVVAVFKHRLDFERSQAEERRIVFEKLTLYDVKITRDDWLL
jgi:hypothetical protein